MRISTTLFFQTGLNSMNAQQADLMHLFKQVGSGQRMVTAADDPLAAAQAINISQAQSLNQRFADNREVAKRNLGMEVNTLDSVTALLQDVKTTLIQAGGVLSDADRKTLANVLAMAKDSLLALANSTDGSSQYLFSGRQGNVMPFTAPVAGGAVSWQGDNGPRLIQVDQTRQLDSGDSGANIFQRAAPGTNGYLSTALISNGTAQISTPTISDSAGANVGNNFKIEFSVALPLEYRITVIDPTGVLPPSDDGWHLYDPNTKSLVMPGIAGAPGGVQVKFSGVPAAGDVFSVQTAVSSDLSIFDTFDSVITALSLPVGGGDIASAQLGNVLASAMQRLDIHYDNVLTVTSSVGVRLNELDAIDANGSLRGLGYTMQLSKLEDLDYYSATASLELRKSALEAAALAFRKIQGVSLFNIGSN